MDSMDPRYQKVQDAHMIQYGLWYSVVQRIEPDVYPKMDESGIVCGQALCVVLCYRPSWYQYFILSISEPVRTPVVPVVLDLVEV